MSTMIARPIQKADMLPATKPERIFKEAPPCFEQFVTSRTWREFVLTNTLVNSGIIAPATVPQLIITESTHHKFGRGLPAESWKSPSRSLLARKVTPMDTAEVIQTRWVKGASKSKSFCPPNFALLIASLMKYETREVTIINARITKSQMIRVAAIVGVLARASARNAINATPVTP